VAVQAVNVAERAVLAGIENQHYLFLLGLLIPLLLAAAVQLEILVQQMVVMEIIQYLAVSLQLAAAVAVQAVMAPVLPVLRGGRAGAAGAAILLVFLAE
jgi:ABC-type Na+ efflux pump permease subunit